MDDATEAELRALLDRDRILSLANRYFSTIDDGTGIDADWARTIFSPDVRVEHRGFTLEGPGDLAVGNAFVRDGWERTFHLATNAQIDLDGDRAHVRAQLLAIHVHREGGPGEPYVIANVFDADAVRTADGWRLSTLAFRPVWTSGVSHFDLAGEGS